MTLSGAGQINAAKSVCLRGHRFQGDNLVIKIKAGRRTRECRECNRLLARRRYRRDRDAGIPIPDGHTPETRRRLLKVYRGRHRDKVNAHKREWRKQNPHRMLAERLKRNHRMSLAEYKQLLAAQGSKCLICEHVAGDWGRDILVVDHCHVTGKIRGLLCHPCNTALGFFKDSPERMRRAADYVEQSLGRS